MNVRWTWGSIAWWIIGGFILIVGINLHVGLHKAQRCATQVHQFSMMHLPLKENSSKSLKTISLLSWIHFQQGKLSLQTCPWISSPQVTITLPRSIFPSLPTLPLNQDTLPSSLCLDVDVQIKPQLLLKRLAPVDSRLFYPHPSYSKDLKPNFAEFQFKPCLLP